LTVPTRRPALRRDQADGRYVAFDVVVVPFPYADRLAEKRRPALVISSRKLVPYGLIWLAMITSADNVSWPCDVAIDDLEQAGAAGAVRDTNRQDRLCRAVADRASRGPSDQDGGQDGGKAVAQKLRGFWVG
jgi:hypothetical protein